MLVCPSTDLCALVREAQSGSNEAAEIVFNRCRGPLLAVINNVLFQPLRKLLDDDDCLQNTFTEVFARKFSEEVLSSEEALWLYLRKIAMNKVLDAKRKYLVTKRFNIRHEVSLANVHSENDFSSNGQSAHDALMVKEFLEETLVDLVEQLPHTGKQIIELILQGYQAPDIARILHLDDNQVYRTMHWLKKKMTE